MLEHEGDRALGDEKRTNSISLRYATSGEQSCSLVFRIRSVFPVCHQVSRAGVTIFHPCT